MARTPTVVNVDLLKKIHSEMPEDTPKASLYTYVADKYNVEKGEDFKSISALIAKSRILGKTSTSPPRDPNAPPKERKPRDPNAPKKERKPRAKKEENTLNVVKLDPNGEVLPLTDFSEDSVLQWAARMREVRARNNEFYTTDALMFDVRKKILPNDNEKSRAVCQIIRENLSNDVPATS